MDRHQSLLDAFLSQLQKSPAALNEMQLRFINTHFPGNFAWTRRNQLKSISKREY